MHARMDARVNTIKFVVTDIYTPSPGMKAPAEWLQSSVFEIVSRESEELQCFDAVPRTPRNDLWQHISLQGTALCFGWFCSGVCCA